jgi:hypothetical protein
MSTQLSRRTLLAGASATGLALALPGRAAAQQLTYAAFRVVRVRPGDPARPQITLPAAYEILPGANYSVASRAEYYTFVRGPQAAGIDVQVDWPGVPIRAVVHQETRLDLRRHRDGVSFTLPMTQPSADANQPTLQVWSNPAISPALYYSIEHNDPDRVAGPWASVAWPEGETRSVVHQLIAVQHILTDSGMLDVAEAKGHRFALLGFETNNTLHADNPPHWHISYNSGPDFSARTHNPHLWLNTQGGTFYNGMDVTGLGRLKYYAGDPAPIYDFIGDANNGRGDLVVTITIRDDGGLDIDTPEGRSYAIAAGRNGNLLDEVTVLEAGRPWLRVTTRDLVKLGILIVRIDGLRNRSDSRYEVVRYDPLTGVLIG